MSEPRACTDERCILPAGHGGQGLHHSDGEDVWPLLAWLDEPPAAATAKKFRWSVAEEALWEALDELTEAAEAFIDPGNQFTESRQRALGRSIDRARSVLQETNVE